MYVSTYLSVQLETRDCDLRWYLGVTRVWKLARLHYEQKAAVEILPGSSNEL